MNIDISPSLLREKMPRFESEWRLWEKKNLNIHRGIIELQLDEPPASINEFAAHIRNGIKSEFRPGWLRGFGYGTVLHCQALSPDFAKICDQIDTRNKKNGVWQWAILQFDREKLAVGVHTWLSGFFDHATMTISGHSRMPATKPYPPMPKWTNSWRP